jgi:hypothetical protein
MSGLAKFYLQESHIIRYGLAIGPHTCIHILEETELNSIKCCYLQTVSYASSMVE